MKLLADIRWRGCIAARNHAFFLLVCKAKHFATAPLQCVVVPFLFCHLHLLGAVQKVVALHLKSEKIAFEIRKNQSV